MFSNVVSVELCTTPYTPSDTPCTGLILLLLLLQLLVLRVLLLLLLLLLLLMLPHLLFVQQ
jgi:hypothetical protein